MPNPSRVILWLNGTS